MKKHHKNQFKVPITMNSMSMEFMGTIQIKKYKIMLQHYWKKSLLQMKKGFLKEKLQNLNKKMDFSFNRVQEIARFYSILVKNRHITKWYHQIKRGKIKSKWKHRLWTIMNGINNFRKIIVLEEVISLKMDRKPSI